MLLPLAVLTALLLSAMFADFALGQRRLLRLGSVAPAGNEPRLSIVVAARNEARGIEAAVTSLLKLDYPRLEIIVVDDRSTDGTGAILERLSSATGRLRVVHVTALPPGWLGKNHALHMGASQATGDLLLFTDADVVFEPTTLRRATALVQQRKLDHLTAIPEAHAPGVAVRAFVAAFGVFFSLYARPWNARNPRSRAHVGIGAFNLIRSGAYRAIGGHEAIAMRPDDDMKLGKLLKLRGFRQDVVDGRGFVSVEWYASLRELVDGLMKNSFAGVDYSLWKAAGATGALLATYVWPFVAVITTAGAVRALNGLCVLLVVGIFSTVNRSRVLYVLAFPPAAVLFAYIIWRSALIAVTTGTVTWRGTKYPLAALKANRI
jgi:glycosyltransferase involved in cell wall biosynthesis